MPSLSTAEWEDFSLQLNKSREFLEDWIESEIKAGRIADRTDASIRKALQTMVSYQKTLKGTQVDVENLVSIYKQYKSTLENTTKTTAEQQNALNELNDKYKDAVERIIENKNELEKERKIREKLQEAIDFNTRGVKGHLTAVKNSMRGVADLISPLTKLGGLFGAGTIGIAAAKDAVIKYNQSMFSLGRIQRMHGNELKNMGSVFEKVRTTTVLSTNDFLDFANSMSKGYLGIKPTAEEMASFAADLQKSFGPNVDVVKQKMEELMGIQRKWPELYDNIRKAQDASNKNDTKTLSVLQMAIIKKGRAIGLSQEEIDTALQSTMKRSRGENKLLALNTEQSKAAQSAADLNLKMGQDAQKAFIMAAKAAQLFYNSLKKISAIAISVMAIFSGSTIASDMISGYKGAIKLIPSLRGIFEWKKKIADLPDMMGGSPKMPKGGQGGISYLSGGKWKYGVPGGGGIKGLDSGIGNVSKGAGGALGKAGGALMSNAGAIFTTGLTAAFAAPAAMMAAWEFGSMIGSMIRESFIGKWAGLDVKSSKRRLDKASATIEEGPAGTKSGGIVEASYQEWKKNQKKGKNSLEDYNAAMKTRKEKRELFGEERKAGADRARSAQREKEAVKKSTEELMKMVDAYNEQRQNLEQNLQIINDISNSLSEQVQIAKSFGAVDPFMLELNVKQAKDALAELGSFADFAQKNISDQFQKIAGKDLTIDLSASQDKQSQGVREQINAQIKEWEALVEAQKKAGKEGSDEQNNTIEKIKLARTLMQDASKYPLLQAKGFKQLTDKVKEQTDSQYEGIKGVNDAYESRLALERDLTETAQFGMGASVQMMQQQVDMMVQMNNEAVKRRELLDVNTKSALNLSDAELKAMKSTKTGVEALGKAREIAATKGLDADKEKQYAEALLWYAKEQQNSVKEQMQYQKKILELTKEIREGYLDAMKEMAFGGGEFAEIIATQTQSTEEMVRLVNKFSGATVANSMALGGITQAGSAGYNARQAGSQFTLNGMVTPDQANNEARGTDIWGMQKSKEDFKKLASGQTQGMQIGTGMSPLSEQGIRIIQEKMEDGGTAVSVGGRDAGDSLRQGGKDCGRNLLDIVNKGVLKQEFGHNEKLNPNAPESATNIGIQQAARAQGSAPASMPAPPSGSPPGSLPTPPTRTIDPTKLSTGGKQAWTEDQLKIMMMQNAMGSKPDAMGKAPKMKVGTEEFSSSELGMVANDPKMAAAFMKFTNPVSSKGGMTTLSEEESKSTNNVAGTNNGSSRIQIELILPPGWEKKILSSEKNDVEIVNATKRASTSSPS